MTNKMIYTDSTLFSIHSPCFTNNPLHQVTSHLKTGQWDPTVMLGSQYRSCLLAGPYEWILPSFIHSPGDEGKAKSARKIKAPWHLKWVYTALHVCNIAKDVIIITRTICNNDVKQSSSQSCWFCLEEQKRLETPRYTQCATPLRFSRHSFMIVWRPPKDRNWTWTKSAW